jgi:enoyl-CoA hydratase/carnithine racemase
MSERQYIVTAIDESVFWITIDHAPVNTINSQVVAELDSAVDEFVAHPTCKVAIITGGEKAVFVSGADISESAERIASGKGKDLILNGQRLFHKISECSKPIIAAINGLALGGGMELAMACHLRVMSERAKLAQPEINLGIIPGWGGTQMLPRIVGRAKAIELILTGESISTQEAFRLNLVNKVVPRKEVLKAARDLARKIAVKGGLAVRAGMDSIRMSTQLQMMDGLTYEAGQLTNLIESADAREGFAAFLKKRQPVFQDK